ncbi:calpain family cysteine protease domain-containing protein [Phthorimaea operculella]|nr:calpain family cysteine protease domain-containing protein [Phthorimaea operculella]
MDMDYFLSALEDLEYEMTDYERIKQTCLARGELWEDPDFPATQTSVFYHQTPPFQFLWKRAKDIYSSPYFVLDNCDTFDVVPGKLGDKWLVSCLGVLYLSKGLFYRVVPADQRMDSPYAGVFRFRLWWCGQWLEVLVDDRLPTVNGKLAFLQTTHTDQLWPALLEKAYAKLHGSYEALKYGSLLDGLADLTGGITESLPIPDAAEPSVLASLLNNTSVVTAHYLPAANEDKVKGIELEMNYRIYNIEKVEGSDGTVHLVRLRRPPAPGDTPSTYVVLDHALWKTIPLYERERLTSSHKGFWMLYPDFLRSFSRLEVVHLDAETSRAEPSLTDKHKWQMRMHQGGWRRGVSAGGCRNYVNFFHMNPQIQVMLSEPDTVVVSLNQHSIMEPKVIGFSVYKMPMFLTETASQLWFKRIKSAINSQYTNSRQVSHRCQLEAGAYLIMPTTFEPREEANFSLRIFSNKSLKMKVLDHAPQMLKAAVIKAPPGMESSGSSFAQYEAVFLQLADEHRTIDAFELQELLDACLPNDYIKSCASIDTCRQIVLSMDKNGTGRISLSDFKDLMCSLKHWQLVFKSHAREKMGVLRAERLRDALRHSGPCHHKEQSINSSGSVPLLTMSAGFCSLETYNQRHLSVSSRINLTLFAT